MDPNIDAKSSWKLIFEISGKMHELGARPEHKTLYTTITLAQAKVMGVVFEHAPNSVMLKDIANELKFSTWKRNDSILSL